MIKNCIIYRYSDGAKDNWKIDENKFSSIGLEDCLQEASGLAKKRIKSLIEITRNEKISIEEEKQTYHIASFSCEFRPPKLIASSDTPPFVPVNFRIWLRKKSSLVVSFDAGKKLSGAAVTLLSHATTGSPSSIDNMKLEKTDFANFKNWLLSESHSFPGQIRGITMHGVEEISVNFKKIILNSFQLEKSPLFNQLFSYASTISNMSFLTPPLKSTNRPLSCRINNWGGLTIYTSHLLDSELFELIEIFESLWSQKA